MSIYKSIIQDSVLVIMYIVVPIGPQISNAKRQELVLLDHVRVFLVIDGLPVDQPIGLMQIVHKT